MVLESELIGHFLPEKLLEFFKIEKFEELGEVTTRKMCFYIYLEERNVIPMGYESSMYESKGFYPATTHRRQAKKRILSMKPLHFRGLYDFHINSVLEFVHVLLCYQMSIFHKNGY